MIHVFSFFGLGGAIWSSQIRDYVCARLAKLDGVKVYPTRGFSEWRSVASQIKALPDKDKVVVIGHSMGSGAASYCTDAGSFIDLVVSYDCAGQAPSRIGRNTGKVLEFVDRAFAIVPKFRYIALPGHSQKIVTTETLDGHTGQPSDPKLLRLVVDEVQRLKGVNK